MRVPAKRQRGAQEGIVHSARTGHGSRGDARDVSSPFPFYESVLVKETDPE